MKTDRTSYPWDVKNSSALMDINIHLFISYKLIIYQPHFHFNYSFFCSINKIKTFADTVNYPEFKPVRDGPLRHVLLKT